MSVIKLGTNTASLMVQRNLATATSALQTSFERLSSGLRINSAKDDAAGLALRESLNADARVYTQAVRNVNEGISLLNVAESALHELSNILVRQMELSEQAANGTISCEQRLALHKEANALVDEYNRIVSSTEYNDRKLFLTSSAEIGIQAGYNSSGSITFTLADELSRTAGDGTFSKMHSFSSGDGPTYVDYGDINGDGILDIVTADWLDARVSVFIGNGDGSFAARSSFATGGNAYMTRLADLDGDSYLDVVVSVSGSDNVQIFMGNGDGSFNARLTYAVGDLPRSLDLGDLNGDGFLDIVTPDAVDDTISVIFGNGDGSFSARTSINVGDNPQALVLGDVNQDGSLDIIVAEAGADQVSVRLGAGDGTFGTTYVFAVGDNPTSVSLGDLDGDGYLDIVTSDWGSDQVSILLGCGDGRFSERTVLSTGDTPTSVTLGDLNGDGLLDIVTSDQYSSEVSIFVGEGNGTFSARTTVGTGARPWMTALADLNSDGALDMLTAEHTGDTISVFLANTEQVTTMPVLWLYDNAEESMEILEESLARVTSELGVVGAMQSRFSHTVSCLQQMRENYLSAKSRITDVDVALEAAALVRNQILQQAAAAVLAQANEQPSIVLLLLDN